MACVQCLQTEIFLCVLQILPGLYLGNFIGKQSPTLLRSPRRVSLTSQSAARKLPHLHAFGASACAALGGLCLASQGLCQLLWEGSKASSSC